MHFFLVSFWVHGMEGLKKKAVIVGIIFAIDIVCLALFVGILKWI